MDRSNYEENLEFHVSCAIMCM